MKNKILLAGLMALMPIAMANSHDMQSHMSQQQISPDGKLSVSYGYSVMGMSGNRDGTGKASTMDVLSKGYMMAPVSMTAQQHNIGLGYAPSQAQQFNINVPYIINNMTHENMMGHRSKARSEGLGDIKLGGKTTLQKQGNGSFNTYYGLSLPTGSTSKKDKGDTLDYMMQTGSGTVDPSLGVAYEHEVGNWNLSIGADTTLRLYDNSEDYRLGNRYALNVGVANRLDKTVTAYGKVSAVKWEKIHGENRDIDPMMSSSNDPENYGGERVDGTIGMSLAVPSTDNVRVSTEFGIPLYQNLNGPQLEADYHFMVNLGGEL